MKYAKQYTVSEYREGSRHSVVKHRPLDRLWIAERYEDEQLVETDSFQYEQSAENWAEDWVLNG